MKTGKYVLPIAVAAAMTFAATPSEAGKANDTLTWLSNSEPDNLDMYQNTLREGIILGRHIWDSLMEVDPDTGSIVPNLATSYKWIDDTTIEFELRNDVVFHNGQKFSADDVVYTMNFISDPKNVVALSTTAFIAGAEKLGPYRARVKLKYPMPAAMQYLASVLPIYPHEHHGKLGKKGMATEPIGTGPYRVTEVTYGRRFVLEKFDGYMKDGPKASSIGKLVFRQIEERGTQIAELLSGGADWIWRVPPDLAKNLQGRKGITVSQGDTMRVGYLVMDAAGRTGDTPLKNPKVRQAISHAIDRDIMRRQLMGEASQLLHVPCYPTQFGCTDEGAKRYGYDPAKAKQLLAEAGFPNGFDVQFIAYRDRPIAEAVIGQLREVGITARLQYMTAGAYRDLRRKHGTELALGTWGSYSINDVTAILSNFFEHGPDDMTRDDEVKRLLEAGNTTDQEVRKKVYAEALQRIAEQAYWLPLFSWVYNYAYTDELEFTPSPDEVPRFWNARWK